MNQETVFVDGREIPIRGERNLLELIRNAGIDIPTFCYHSDLSVYSACRLCIVDIEGMGIVTSCSTIPAAGMKVKTTSEEIRRIRKLAVELLLASHERECTTCGKNENCQLQSLAKKFGIERIRFASGYKPMPIDQSSPSLVRNPNKCILCGDCVRACHERQSIGAIDFAMRGASSAVLPAFGKDLNQVECVHCGQCASVCPTGAITIRQSIDEVWKEIENPAKKVVVQIAPAVRVALGEYFGMDAGTITTGQMVAGLKAIGFDQVYDTSFTADLTVIEETTEFLSRFTKGEKLPQFTSCCPAWVKFAEQYYPGLIGNLSSCKSPQQMFGSLAKEILPGRLGVSREDLVVVSIMPCTAKKYEATLPKFSHDGIPDVDHVLTTQEVGRMMEQRGLRFSLLEPESFDMPFGFKTGAGVIFGASGGVTEAVLRFAAEKVTGLKIEPFEYRQVRGAEGIREAEIDLGGARLRLAVVYGLGNARKIADQVKAGTGRWDLIEVMSCPGGCVGGAGQPVTSDRDAAEKRAKGIYNSDKTLQFHKSQENPVIREIYADHLGDIGGKKAHHLLHTAYAAKRRISGEEVDLTAARAGERVEVRVCLGTSCMVRGSQELLSRITAFLEEKELSRLVDVKATFCFERCDRGPTITVGTRVIERCTPDQAFQAITEAAESLKAGKPAGAAAVAR